MPTSICGSWQAKQCARTRNAGTSLRHRASPTHHEVLTVLELRESQDGSLKGVRLVRGRFHESSMPELAWYAQSQNRTPAKTETVLDMRRLHAVTSKSLASSVLCSYATTLLRLVS